MNEPVLYELDGGVATITLNRPATRNALTEMEVVDALVASLARAQADLSVRAIVLTGAGPAFSSGGNIKHMRDELGTFAGNAARIRENYRRGIQRIPRAFHELDVPCIAAVNGPAHGAGRSRADVRYPYRRRKRAVRGEASPRSASFLATAARGCCRVQSVFRAPRK